MLIDTRESSVTMYSWYIYNIELIIQEDILNINMVEPTRAIIIIVCNNFILGGLLAVLVFQVEMENRNFLLVFQNMCIVS